ncbi:heavy-metal-associated domain-containing protein [Sulfurimonas microaerophilic]|uniref:heavy-metal-associated domain-containing protein n=1 Tax=Sulfurimonas microaerophilic TaxID=3058392 RepID=UPI0027153B20|nr:cation transporter [Sulfurimonas sp. hsl 1-7]
MIQTFQVQNVKCTGCANTLTTKLKEQFGEIEVNLDVMPREITLKIVEEEIEMLRRELKKLGYPMSDEKLDFLDTNAAKAKSFVSCAIGKFELAKE